MSDKKDNYLPVEKLFALSEKLKFSLTRLRGAGMMKKAEAAQIVLDDIHEAMLTQNKIINNLVYENMKINQKLDLLNGRVAAYV